MELAHIRSPKRLKFIEEYVTHGNAVRAAREAGYDRGDPIKLKNHAKTLKNKLKLEIEAQFREKMETGGPKAYNVMEDLLNSESDSVRYNAAKDLLDRAGHKPIERIEHTHEHRSVQEMEAHLIALVGSDGAKLLMGSIKTKNNDSPQFLEN